MTVTTPLIKDFSEQYLAMLKMVQDTIDKCKDELWEDYSHEVVTSQLVYHIVFSAGFWLARNNDEKKAFNEKYSDNGPPFNKPNISFSKHQLSAIIDEIKGKADKLFSSLTVEELTNTELYDLQGSKSLAGSLLFGIRHTMNHIGALHVRLTQLGNDQLPWVNQVYGDERDRWEEMNNEGVTDIIQGKLDDAQNIYLELCTKTKNPGYYYNLACVYSRKNNSEKSLEALKNCLKLDKHNGFKDLAKTDSDFDNIREVPAFQQLISP